MPIRVEVEADALRFVRKRCTPEEQDEFYSRLRSVESEPIKNSEACRDPELSPYMLRCFRFGMNKAVFELDAFRNKIRVLECKRLKPPSRHPKSRMPGDPSHN
jgi:hypothetical protein